MARRGPLNSLVGESSAASDSFSTVSSRPPIDDVDEDEGGGGGRGRGRSLKRGFMLAMANMTEYGMGVKLFPISSISCNFFMFPTCAVTARQMAAGHSMEEERDEGRRERSRERTRRLDEKPRSNALNQPTLFFVLACTDMLVACGNKLARRRTRAGQRVRR